MPLKLSKKHAQLLEKTCGPRPKALGVDGKARKLKGPTKPGPDPFIAACVAAGIEEPTPEYAFHPTRKWRADYAFAEMDVLLEIEGGAFVGGRHTYGAGFEKDCEKYAEALCLGWFVLRVTPRMVKDGRVFDWLLRIQKGA
jgi:hypothetical protein